MQKNLTVIIPVYNGEAYIERCLESLFNQSYPAMEIIVVDDASTDNTLSLLTSFQKKLDLKIIHLEQNHGAGFCRNIGIAEVRTPYLTFVDADDWVDISTYARCLKRADEQPDIIIYGLIYDFVQYNCQENKYVYKQDYKMSGEFALSIYAHTIPNEIRITPIVNNKVYRTQFLREQHILFHEELRYQEDDAFTFLALAKARAVLVVSGCFYHYCQHPDSLIHTISEDALTSFVLAYRKLREDLEYINLFQKYEAEYYLKLKGSLLGVLKRIIDYELCPKHRIYLVSSLLTKLHEQDDFVKILDTLDFSRIRMIL